MDARSGSRVLRVEDEPLLRGARSFTDDLARPDALHAVFVRSPFAHARIASVDASSARTMPGVVTVCTAADLSLPPLDAGDAPDAMRRPPIAHDVVRFAGEVVAVVVAETRAEAVEAAERVDVDLGELEPLTDPELALAADAPLLFEGAERGNLAAEGHLGNRDGDAIAGAEVVVGGRFVSQRLAPVPMEPAVGLAAPDPDHPGSFVLWTPSQAPHAHRDAIACCLGIEPERLRVVAPATGGGFGARAAVYPETVVVVALARRLGRAVRFVETRSETMTTMAHGRGQVQDAWLAGTPDGRVTGLQVRVVADAGAYPALSAGLPYLTGLMACGVYDIPAVDYRFRVVTTTTTPVGAYRGAGRPEATALIERLMDAYAVEVGLDPAVVRRRNLIRALPHTTPTGADYDSGDYAAALEAVLDTAGYAALRVEQRARRARGAPVQLGIGLGCYVEWTGFGSEFAACEVAEDGVVTVRSGTAAQGQGHETTYAQLAGAMLGVPVEEVRVVESDTAEVPRGGGTMGSRSLQVGGSAVRVAAEQLLAQASPLAARLLEADPTDVVVHPGRGVGVAGLPGTAVSWARLAAAAGDAGLRGVSDYESEGSTYPFGAHLAVVEVDVETGGSRLVRHVSVDDAGTLVNPMIVEGQVHGGIAQGAAQALFEEVVFDDLGTNLTGTLASYALPGPRDLPRFDTHRTETPTDRNALGAKGIGEAGTIGSTPAVWNAVIDAVSHLGVRAIDMPTSPMRVWQAIRAAQSRDATVRDGAS